MQFLDLILCFCVCVCAHCIGLYRVHINAVYTRVNAISLMRIGILVIVHTAKMSSCCTTEVQGLLRNTMVNASCIQIKPGGGNSGGNLEDNCMTLHHTVWPARESLIINYCLPNPPLSSPPPWLVRYFLWHSVPTANCNCWSHHEKWYGSCASGTAAVEKQRFCLSIHPLRQLSGFANLYVLYSNLGFVYLADADFVYSPDSVWTCDNWYTNGHFTVRNKPLLTPLGQSR